MPTDARSYDMVKEILDDLCVKSIKLLTNSPAKINSLEKQNINITSTESIHVIVNKYNKKYLTTKILKLGNTIKFRNVQ